MDVPRPYGRRPVALRALAESIEVQLERELREAGAQDSSVAVRAYWLRAETAGTGYPDHTRAYVRIAPTVMSAQLCEEIEPLVARMTGVTKTGRGGGDLVNAINPLRPFVYAVINLEVRQRG
jgi:hypothetical protein